MTGSEKYNLLAATVRQARELEAHGNPPPPPEWPITRGSRKRTRPHLAPCKTLTSSHLFVAPLEAAGISQMITGSVASSIIRRTAQSLYDIDLVVLISRPDQIPLLPQLFPEDDFYLPPCRCHRHRIPPRSTRSLQHHPSPHRTLKADIYSVTQSPDSCPGRMDIPAASRHRSTCEITVAPPEYVIHPQTRILPRRRLTNDICATSPA